MFPSSPSPNPPNKVHTQREQRFRATAQKRPRQDSPRERQPSCVLASFLRTVAGLAGLRPRALPFARCVALWAHLLSVVLSQLLRPEVCFPRPGLPRFFSCDDQLSKPVVSTQGPVPAT